MSVENQPAHLIPPNREPLEQLQEKQSKISGKPGAAIGPRDVKGQISRFGEFHKNLSSHFSCSEDFRNLPGKPILVIQRNLLREIPDSSLGSREVPKADLVNCGMTTPTSMWEVEYAESVEHESDGSIIPDTAKYVTRDFATKEAALRFASKVVERDVFGSVAIAQFHLEPYETGYPGAYREYDGDTEYVKSR